MTTDAMTAVCPEVLRLRPGVFLAANRSGQEYLLHRSSSQRLGMLTRTQRDVLHQLAGSKCPADTLRAVAGGTGGDAGVAELGSLLDQLRTGGWLHITVIGENGPAYTIQPHRRPGPLPAGDDQAGLALSRFAVMRRSAGGVRGGPGVVACTAGQAAAVRPDLGLAGRAGTGRGGHRVQAAPVEPARVVVSHAQPRRR